MDSHPNWSTTSLMYVCSVFITAVNRVQVVDLCVLRAQGALECVLYCVALQCIVDESVW